PVSICINGNGIFAGQNAFWAKRTNVMESFPPENNSTGFSNCAATSLIIYMASCSNALALGLSALLIVFGFLISSASVFKALFVFKRWGIRYANHIRGWPILLWGRNICVRSAGRVL